MLSLPANYKRVTHDVNTFEIVPRDLRSSTIDAFAEDLEYLAKTADTNLPICLVLDVGAFSQVTMQGIQHLLSPVRALMQKRTVHLAVIVSHLSIYAVLRAYLREQNDPDAIHLFQTRQEAAYWLVTKLKAA